MFHFSLDKNSDDAYQPCSFSLTVCFYIIYNDMVMVSKLISQYIVNKIRDIFYFFHGIFFLQYWGLGCCSGHYCHSALQQTVKLEKYPHLENTSP